MCEKCNKYLTKDYKNCPKCGSLLTSKFDHDKKIIEELEKLTEGKNNILSVIELTFMQNGRCIILENLDLYNLYRKLILTKIKHEIEPTDRFFVDIETVNWLIPYGKENLHSYVEDRLKSLFPTKIILQPFAFGKTEINERGERTGKIVNKVYKTLIFTEHELENAFEFFRDKNWLTDDLLITREANNYNLAINKPLSKDISYWEYTKSPSCIQYLNAPSNIENPYKPFKDSDITNVYSMNKILKKYKQLIINDLIMKQIEPQNDSKKECLTQK